MKEKYYITTAIAYTSGKPHIGNSIGNFNAFSYVVVEISFL